jgi:2-polyprenyl-3-methyl-5-hydroxy-6-metoxy-1,4-benzoquinol methylase
MKKPTFNNEWPESYKVSYQYDIQEFFGDISNLGYTYAYQNRFNQAINAVKKYVPIGDRIIDVAAAQGNFSLALAELGYIVTWNDLRSELADYVKLKWETGNINYMAGNCFELNFPEPFDAVLITEIIEHVAHPDIFLQNIASLVKPGGYIIMTTPNGEYIRNTLPRFSDCPDPSLYEDMQFKPDADGHIFLLHRDEIVSLVKKSGLILTELKLFTNFFTNGHIKTGYLLPFLPKSLVNLLESITAFKNGNFSAKLNTHTLAVIQKPMI